MVSESNKNRRHLRISNTHDQIHYNNNTSKPGGHIQEYPIQICSFFIIDTLLIVKMFNLPGLIRCETPTDCVSSRHLPYPCDCLNLSPSSALSHFCMVVWPVAIL